MAGAPVSQADFTGCRKVNFAYPGVSAVDCLAVLIQHRRNCCRSEYLGKYGESVTGHHHAFDLR
jgi:hypothetical protein